MKKIMPAVVILVFLCMSANAAIIVNKVGPYYVGDTIGFNKTCHDTTRDDSEWDFGDGTTLMIFDDLNHGWQKHVYTSLGLYTVRYTHGVGYFATCGASDAEYTEIYKITILSKRSITYQPGAPKTDQLVNFQAINFAGPNVNWNFGDGTALTGGVTQSHRFNGPGTYKVTAAETSIAHDPVTATITILPDDRFIQISVSEVLMGLPVTLFARNFNGNGVLWNFGDGTIEIGGHTISHIYNRPGNYTITAIDESGASKKTFTTNIKIFGITDEVLLEIAELKFSNGKYFIVAPRNSKMIKPLLKLKMRGTGVITGQWLYNGAVLGLINELARQGEVKEITMDRALPLPTMEPGLHTVSFRLTKPETGVTFPTLRYYVLPYEKGFDVVSPPDGFVAKDSEISEFSWEAIQGGAAKYQIAFSKSLYDLLNSRTSVKWTDVKGKLNFTPGKNLWNGLTRNRWTYWKVRAFDSFNNVIGESGINEIKVVVASAEITLNKVTNLDGKKISINGNGIYTEPGMLLINGSIEYKGDSKFLILQVEVNDKKVDQLLFRDVKRGDIRNFETSIPSGKKGKIVFRILKSSSPSVIVGLKGIILK